VPALEVEVATRLAHADVGGAVAAIVRALGPGLYGYLSAILRNDEDARDVLGDVTEHLLTSLPRFRGECGVKTWTYRIAWRTAMRHRQDPRRQRTTALRSSVAEALVAEVQRSTAAYRRDAAVAWLERVRAELSCADQSLLTLRLDREMSWAEVADVMGTGDTAADLAALRKRYERIKDRLRRAAERDGIVV
jgi:RNA polymerase sigma-70 factor (ECF subfamily)